MDVYALISYKQKSTKILFLGKYTIGLYLYS